MKKFDLYWAKYAYDDKPNQFKIRPVLVIDNRRYYALSAKITSHSPRNSSKEYTIIDWKQAGLKVKSTIRLSKIIQINKVDFKKYIGHLSATDIANVKSILHIK